MDDEIAERPNPISALVAAAAAGDQRAWHDIVDHFSPLLAGVIRQFHLTPAEVEDVAQTVWLRLVEHLDELRDPRALPMWIITVGRRETWRFVAAQRQRRSRELAGDEWTLPPSVAPLPEEELLRAERHQTLLAGLAQLEAGNAS